MRLFLVLAVAFSTAVVLPGKVGTHDLPAVSQQGASAGVAHPFVVPLIGLVAMIAVWHPESSALQPVTHSPGTSSPRPAASLTPRLQI